jgi:hypothetical protein
MHDLWRHRVEWFWQIWMTLSIASAVISALLVRMWGSLSFQQGDTVPASAATKQPSAWSRVAGLAIILFCLFTAGYIALILAGERFDYYDNSQLTLYSLKGHNYPPPIWIGLGRFFPLAFQEFNVIQHFSRTVFAYHALPIFELIVVCLLLLTLDRELKMTARICLAVFLLLTPGMVISFGGLIYPERNVIFWLLLLATFVDCFDKRPTATMAAAAIISAQFLLYYKETAFLFLWGFAVGRLLIRCRNARQPGWDFSRLREKSSCLDLCLFSLGILFLLYYGTVMFRNTHLQYANQRRLPEIEMLLSYLKMDLLAWLFVAVVIGRAYLIWKRRIMPLPLWEGLAYGASTYFAAFLGLRIFSAYYLAPVDVIAVLYLGRLIVLSWTKQHVWSRIAITMAFCAVLLQSISLSTFRVYERKNLIREKDQIASVIRSRYQESGQTPLRLYFPYATPHLTMEFAAYLSYREIPIEGVEAGPDVKTNVVLVCRALAATGPLQDYQGIIGHAGSMPKPDDLVIILPDDIISHAEVDSYVRGGDLLFSSEPQPSLPHAVFQFFSHCHIASPEFDKKTIPDHWLCSSVTEWKQPAGSGSPAP